MKSLYLFVSLILFVPLSAFSQSFTKEQMLEDFDFLYGKLDSVNARFAIIKSVTGVDILSDVKKVRESLDTVTTDKGFYDCLYKAISLCKDSHISFDVDYPYGGIDKSIIQQSMKNANAFYDLGIAAKYDVNINPFQVYYVDGEYFVPNIYENDYTYTIKIPQGSKLLKINDLTIDEYVKQWMLPVAQNVKWDKKNKIFYVDDLLSPKRTGQGADFWVTYSYHGKVEEVDLNTYKIKFPNNNGKSTPKVLYFNRDKILYLRIPQMAYQNIENYKQALLKYKDKEIHKVMIDVRGNPGGADRVWLEIISAIIKKEIPYPQEIAFRDNRLVKETLRKANLDFTTDDIYKKALTIAGDTFFCLINNERVISPAANSLGYDGNIYVLIDDRIFSSTLAFAAICQNSDQLTTVGTPSGYFGGQGVTPLYYMMPNTKLIFRIECSLDCTHVIGQNLDEYYHDQPEILVEPTLVDLFKIRNSSLELYEENYLYNIDPVFKKVLKLP